jgi:hypothetical protein
LRLSTPAWPTSTSSSRRTPGPGQVGAQGAEESRLRQRGRRERGLNPGHAGPHGQGGYWMGCHPEACRGADAQRGRRHRPSCPRGRPPCRCERRGKRPHAPHVGDSGTAGENDKSKLAKRVKLARSTDLWCLLPFTPVTQEAMDKPRKVCRSTSGGRSARPQTAGTSTRRSVSWPTTAREKSPRQRACCGD